MIPHIRVTLLTFFAVGVTATIAAFAGATGGDPLATYEVTLTPNYVSPNDGAASNYQSVWVYPRSPTTPYRSPDSLRQQSRYLLLDPRTVDSDGRSGRDEWWFVIERNWPSSFDPNKHGNWGRLVNFHNVAGDVGWGTGSGVSALALDWLPGASAPQFTLEYHDGGKPHYLPAPARDTFHTYVVHFIAGRTDGSTPRPGALRVWADGANTPVINLTNINTLQRYNGVTQKWMQLWEGDYTQALQTTSRVSFVLTRIGATLAQALADRPVAIGTTAPGQFYTGSGVNLGPPSATQIASHTSDKTLVPEGLDGTVTTILTTPTTSSSTSGTTTQTSTAAPAGDTVTTSTSTTAGDTTAASGGTATTATTTTSSSTKADGNNGKGPRKGSETRMTSAVEGVALLEWDGRLFNTAKAVREYVTAKGVDWNAFLGKHPAVVKALGVPSIAWDGTTFFSQAALVNRLAKSGISYQQWAKAHPEATAILAGTNGAGAHQVTKKPSRIVTAATVVTWDGIAFTTAASMRAYFRERQLDWDRFLVMHPSIASKLGVSSVKWDGQVFFSRAALTSRLNQHGIRMKEWARNHPAAAAKLS